MYTPVVLALFLLVSTAALAVAAILLRRWAAHRAVAPAMAVLAAISGISFCLVAGGFELRKLAGACAMPTGLLWLGLGAMSLAAADRGRRGIAAAACCLWLGYTAAGNVWIARALMAGLERQYSSTDPLALAPMDAVLVLGGGISVHEHGQIFLGDSGDRLMLAARLQLAGTAEILVPSGPPWPPGQPTTTVPELSSTLWQELGVPEERIVLLEGPRNTSEEVCAFARLAEERGWRRVGLLSSAWHLRRASRLGEKHGIQMVPLPADFRSTPMKPRPEELVPQGPAFANVHRAAWEYLGAALGQ